jgi:uncharacterized membrane protein
MVEYPTPGVWRIGFVATRAKGEIRERHPGKDLLAIFIPNTPNVTAGFLTFVPRKDVIILDMSIEEAAKMIISAGLVAPDANRPEMTPPVPASPVREAAE